MHFLASPFMYSFRSALLHFLHSLAENLSPTLFTLSSPIHFLSPFHSVDARHFWVRISWLFPEIIKRWLPDAFPRVIKEFAIFLLSYHHPYTLPFRRPSQLTLKMSESLPQLSNGLGISPSMILAAPLPLRSVVMVRLFFSLAIHVE